MPKEIPALLDIDFESSELISGFLSRPSSWGLQSDDSPGARTPDVLLFGRLFELVPGLVQHGQRTLFDLGGQLGSLLFIE